MIKWLLMIALLPAPVLGDTVFKDSFEKDYSDCSTVTLTGDQIRWGDLFKNIFPGPDYQKVRVEIPETGYLAVRFYTGAAVDDGFLSNIEAAGTPGWRLGAISLCAGKFDAEKACIYKWGDHGGIPWNTRTSDPAKCNLKPNTTYYWNITFTDGVDPASSRCAGSYCMTTLTPVNNDF